MTWKERPVDFVSTLSGTTAYRLHVAFVSRVPHDDAQVASAHWTGAGKVYSHHFSLALQIMPYNSDRCLILRRRPVLKLRQSSLDYLEPSETNKLRGR